MESGSGSRTFLSTDWQIHPSKTYPHRKFYFNPRTGEAAWELPSDVTTPSCNLAAIKIESVKEVQKTKPLLEENKGETLSRTSSGVSSFGIRSPVDLAPEDSNASDISDAHSVNSSEGANQGFPSKIRKWHSKKPSTALKASQNMNSKPNQNKTAKKIKLTRPSFSSNPSPTNEQTKNGQSGSTMVEPVKTNTNKTLTKTNTVSYSVPVQPNWPLQSPSPQIKKSALKVVPSKDVPAKKVQFKKEVVHEEIDKPFSESLPKQAAPSARFSLPSQTRTSLQAQDEESPMEIDEVVDEEKMMIDIQEVRESLKKDPQTVCGDLTKLTNNFPSVTSQVSNAKMLCLVVDTNIFIGELGFLKSLPNQIKALNCAFIFLVPWVVLQELDALKNKYLCTEVTPAVSKKARLAVSYLYEELSAPESHIRGQSIVEACSNDTHPENNDDRLLQCCIQYSRKENHAVILFTNDKNLCNKAIVSNITACTKSNITQSISIKLNQFDNQKDSSGIQEKNLGLNNSSPPSSQLNRKQIHAVRTPKLPASNHPMPETPNKVNALGKRNSNTVKNISNGKPKSPFDVSAIRLKIEQILTVVFGRFVETEMEHAYGNNWLKIVCKQPPWHPLDLFECIKQHWFGVFGYVLKKSDQTSLDNLVRLFKQITGDPDCTVNSLNDILLNAMSFLMSAQLHSKDQELINKALIELASLKSKCEEIQTFLKEVSVDKVKEMCCIRTVNEPPKFDSPLPVQRTITLDVDKNIKRKRFFEDENNSSCEPPHKTFAGSQKRSRTHSSPLNQNDSTCSSSAKSSDSNTSEAIKESIANMANHIIHPEPYVAEISLLPNSYSKKASSVFINIWESINHFCGVICDSLEIHHTLKYAKQNQLPPKEETYTFLPRIFPCVYRIFKSLRRVLSEELMSKDYIEACYLLYNALVNFYPSIDSQDEENIENSLTPEMLIAACKDISFRNCLNAGLLQLEEYRSLLHRCITSMKMHVN